MSRYKSLATEEDNAYISPFTVGHTLHSVENCTRATPENPAPNPIPSFFDYGGWQGPISRIKKSEPNADHPPERIIDRSTVYGPSTRGHASLRYYGNGPY